MDCAAALRLAETPFWDAEEQVPGRSGPHLRYNLVPKKPFRDSQITPSCKFIGPCTHCGSIHWRLEGPLELSVDPRPFAQIRRIYCVLSQPLSTPGDQVGDHRPKIAS